MAQGIHLDRVTMSPTSNGYWFLADAYLHDEGEYGKRTKVTVTYDVEDSPDSEDSIAKLLYNLTHKTAEHSWIHFSGEPVKCGELRAT